MLPKSEAAGALQAAAPRVARFSAEQELYIREVPQGFSLGLSLLSARFPTVQAVDRDFQTELSFCSF